MIKRNINSFILLGFVGLILVITIGLIIIENNLAISNINKLQLSYLANITQEVNEKVELKLGNLNSFEKIERETEIRITDIELNTMENLNNIKVKEIKEEVYVNNKLASKELSDVGSNTETEDEKYFRIFGEEGYNKRGRCNYYPNGEQEALKDMVVFQIKVWTLDADENWYIQTVNLQSHKKIMSTFKCIFSELLQLPESERLPIKTIGAYNYRTGSSNHTCGVAVDINWEENAEMTNSGIITAGSFWKPYTNIYSIKPNSAVVQIFEKYGFGWGGYWSSKKDYMHFSYFNR